MIKTEHLTINGRDFVRTYSDSNRYVVREGVSYAEAYDPAGFGRVYIEGDVMEDNSTDEDYAEAGKILMGKDGSGYHRA